jgi:two-component system, OmpR family, phosphate regulon sensor histidine kinase PhoR
VRIDIRCKLLVSQLFAALVTIGILYVYLWFKMGINAKGLQGAFVIGLAAATSASLFIDYILFNDTYRSLLAMAKIAAQIGRGEFTGKAPVSSNDAVGDLAGVMNVMSTRIASQAESLAAEMHRLKAILLGMREGLMVTDAKGGIILVNPAFRDLFSLQDEMEGKSLSAITRLPALHETFREVNETKNERVGEFCFPFQEERTLQTHWFPLVAEEEIQGVVAVFHDISDLKRLEKVRRDFVANVSHELRTPVTIIKGYAEALLSGVMKTDPERSDRFIGIINTHAERLASLIKDLLALSELESRNLAIMLAPFPINGIVRRACLLLEDKARSKAITIALRNIEEMPPVMADPGRLEQVLVNLLDNAIKYTPDQGSVTISATVTDDLVQVSLADTGVGIPPLDLPRIFERFYRVDTARSREQGGTGLGLAIVKHIVQIHGGDIAVESSTGKGSTFTFTLKKAYLS